MRIPRITAGIQSVAVVTLCSPPVSDRADLHRSGPILALSSVALSEVARPVSAGVSEFMATAGIATVIMVMMEAPLLVHALVEAVGGTVAHRRPDAARKAERRWRRVVRRAPPV